MFFIVLSSLSDSFRFLFTQFFFFFLSFLVSKFQGFSSSTLGKTLLSLLYSYITCIHAFSSKISKVRTKRILGFLMILSVLIQFFGWVFVHASFKHDSHALISKFSWFVQNFEIRVYVFLRNLGILFNWMKLSKIGLWYCLIE